MKNFNKYALMGAALLTGAVGMTSCSSDDDFAGAGQPPVSGETVKTQFALNIPRAEGTRMSDANTQNGNPAAFLGMENVWLMPMTAAAADASAFLSQITLPNIGTGELANGTKIYTDVTVPVGATNFLFYASGPMGTGLNDVAGTFAKGMLNATVDAAVSTSTIEFSLQPAKGIDNGEAAAILNVLNAVAGAEGWAQSQDEELKALYNTFVKLTAGSAASVAKTFEWLNNAIVNLNGAEQTAIVAAIQGAMATGDKFVVEGTQVTTALTYPRNINLPDGTAQLTFADGAFAWVADADNAPSFGTMPLNTAKICFPASLYYMANTPLKANDQKVTAWPGNAADWAANAWGGWGNAVLATTRSIALQDNVNYSVANLATTFTAKTASLKDQKGNNIPVPTEGFTVTGMLIGGQPAKVNWNFEAQADFDRTVYDNNIPASIAATYNAVSAANYTLLLQNQEAATVNFAVEFENTTGVDFYGVNGGLIPAGGKFYVVGTLDPAQKTNETTATSVFQKDYKTTAKVTLASLANAYNVLPDLRSTNLQLGLSVDLSWQEGMNFDVEIQ